MEKVMVEKYVYNVGDMLDISKCTSGIKMSWETSTKANHFKASNKRAMVIKATINVQKDDVYTLLLNTGEKIRLTGNELNEAKYLGSVDLSVLFISEE